ncbi:ABC transporter permease [Halogeometricum borinquense DSM 11551]|uniref:ABC transporter permease n=2 Tax=Halogeometricum borinquense TaxID=60847 RepID=E4NMV5_HALBP|nr:ABC transporter permease subunit [Halogeometricum borinquense]ADQ67367.1 ABC-type transport system permease protein [Halogeometricum borinquense DSM 11551]ELY28580.1 ABC transporter permease [Halogeometricum borinquense DSM 11551]RYJ13629.1 PrsW family intramembrane metalloprotease [Halogeometricum borinquense]
MSRSLSDRLRAVLRIARWEIERSARTLDRRTVVFLLVAVVLAGGIASAGMLSGGVALDRDIYRVGVASDSPYYEPVAAAPALTPKDPDPDALKNGDLDILIDRERVFGPPVVTQKNRAALAALNDAVRRYNTAMMQQEENQTAAFPVAVSLQYVSRSTSLPDGAVADGGSDGGAATGDGSGTGADSSGTSAGGSSSSSSNAASGSSATDGTSTSQSGDTAADGSDGPLSIPNLGGINPFSGGSSGSPAEIQPPFPFGSLMLAFAFLVPMNFVVQAYGSTMLNERINRRGELLLVAPVSPGDIVLGKTLPYLTVVLGVTAVIALAVGGGLVSVAAVVPIGLVFLGATFVGAMFARSFKELTFVTVAVSVFLTAYTFVPAIFTQVTPIALISPLTLVVRDLQPTATVSLGAFLFSTGPFVLCGGVLFALGAGVYREEDMFTQRSVPLKFLDALDARVSRPRDVALVSGLSIPFVFIAELLAIAVLFVLPVELTVPVLLVFVALIEEAAKSLHVYAAFEKARFERTTRTALVLGALSGFGFFVAEKFTAVAQIVGLPELTLGRAALGPAGVGLDIGVLPAVGLLLAPLVLHVVTAGISAVGASRGKRWYAASFVGAVAVHAAYNLTVVNALA